MGTLYTQIFFAQEKKSSPEEYSQGIGNQQGEADVQREALCVLRLFNLAVSAREMREN